MSRSHPELVRRLFEREVPELASGQYPLCLLLEKQALVRKLLCEQILQESILRGSLIGPSGNRVMRSVMENLGDEKIDIVDWSNDPAKFIAALFLLHATSVRVVSERIKQLLLLREDQLSLAIGKEGQNARWLQINRLEDWY